MNHGRQHHISGALAALEAVSAHRDADDDGEDLVIVLSDLASIAKQVGILAGQAEVELAPWLTVGAHLRQARDQAAGLARSLNHACGTWAFNEQASAAA